ncbi:uncharacterized protein [Triticum aestivum]|uniref:uncharacterized protein n=1 Tax=Triticum aestivum TaxID=4565 RepID=UPI001D00CC95|nr:uncharacterized protein LOC123188758 [Triticum aestivum]
MVLMHLEGQPRGRASTSLPATQYITQKNGLQVVTTMREERQGCCSGWLLLLEFCWVVLCLFTILVIWLLEAWYSKPDYVPCKDLHHLGRYSDYMLCNCVPCKDYGPCKDLLILYSLRKLI